MDLEKDEKEVAELLEGYRVKEPPEALMRNYVAEVKRKIRESPSGPAFGFPALAAILAVSLIAFAMVFVFLRPKAVQELPVPQPGVVTVATPVHQEKVEESSELLFESLMEDLFVLEMLGEAEGLVQGFDPTEADLEFLAAQ